MKNIWKKIVALICVVSLCVGVFPATTRAVDSYTGKLTIAGAAATSGNPTAFYVKGTDDYKTNHTGNGWPDSTMMPAENDKESGIFVDGVRIDNYYSAHDANNTNVRLRKWSDSEKHYYIEKIPNVQKGSIVTIKGTFYTYGGWLQTDIYDSTPIVYEESSFEWNGSQWVDFTKPALPDISEAYPGALTIEGSAAPSESSGSFYIKGTDAYKTGATGADWPDLSFIPLKGDFESGVFIDGVRVNNYYSAHNVETQGYVRLRKFNDPGNHYYIERLPNVNVGTIVTIKGFFFVYDGWSNPASDFTPIAFEESSFKWNGTKWVDYVQVKEYSGSLTRVDAEQNDAHANAIYLKGNDEYLADDTSGSWEAPAAILRDSDNDATSGIFINNVKQEDGTLIKYNGVGNSYYVKGFSQTPTESDVVKIVGTFYSQDGRASVTFSESNFKWNGTKWVDYVPLKEYSGSLTRVDAERNDAHANAIYLKGNDEYLADDTSGSWDSPAAILRDSDNDATSGIFINNVKQEDGTLIKYNGVGNSYYVNGFSQTPTESDVVKIVGTFYSADGRASVTFAESKFQWNGSAWVDYIEVKNYQGTLSILVDKTNNNQHLYLSTTDEHTAENTGIVIWESKFYAKDVNSGIYVNGKRKADAFMKRTNTYAYYLEEIGTLNAGDKVTIEGTFFVEGNGNTVTFEEFNILWDGNCWLDCSEIKNYAEATFWLDTNSLNTATNLYLRGSVDIHEDCTPSDKPDFGWTTTVGTTGFYKNGVACAGTLKNVGNGGAWYLGLENAGIEVGDKLTIKGTFGYNGRYVKVAEYNLWYTNDGWKITPAITSDTKLYGDANGDNELNSLDLARLIKYINKQPVDIYKEDASGNNTGADANGIDGVNDRDRLKIYEYILEGAKRTVDGSYTVEYYPVYLDDEDIKLGAYNGPRTSGYEDYSYTSGGTLTSRPVAESFLNSTEFERYKNAGLNTLLHEYDGAYSSKAAGIGYGVDDGNFRNYLTFAKEAGLNIYITSMGLSSYIKFEGAGNGPTSIDFNGDGNLSSTAVTIDETKYGWDYNGDGVVSASAQMPEIFYYSDNIKHRDLNSAVYPGQKMTILEADISELFEYIVDNGYQDIFKGIMMPDEPWLVAKDRYTSAINLINALAAEYGLDIDYQGCLYPSYAETDAIGNNYNTYVAAFGTARKSLMYDFYPLQNTKKWYQSSSKNELNTEWLTNLELVAKQGKSNGYTTGITLQSSGFETAQDSGIFANQAYRRDPQSDADIQFQVYSSLAFGIKKINYFTYWEKQFQGDEKFTSSMVEYPAAGGTEGEETAVYGYVKNANTEITKFDHVFMDYDWVNTKAVGSSDLFTTAMKNVELSNVTVSSSSTGNSIISHMYDSEKQLDGYWLVNMAEPSTSTKATLNVTFADKNKAMVYINGEETIVDLTNGVYSADLAVGEGIFIIPLNIQ